MLVLLLDLRLRTYDFQIQTVMGRQEPVGE